MNKSSASLLGMVGGFLLLAGLLAARDVKPPEADPPFHKELLKAAGNYLAWGRIDDESHWAPLDCRPPIPGQPAFSASTDEQTHGRKLYSLFARDRKEYIGLSRDAKVKVGQVIVKQSWIPEEITDSKAKPAKGIDFKKIIRTETSPDPGVDPKLRRSESDYFYPYVWKGEKVFKATKQADLFIMMKLDPKTPDTDQGWVYGTVTPDGKKVTSAGKIESCMKCHVDAHSDRLFGLKR